MRLQIGRIASHVHYFILYLSPSQCLSFVHYSYSRWTFTATAWNNFNHLERSDYPQLDDNACPHLFSAFSKNNVSGWRNIKSLVKLDMFCHRGWTAKDEKVCSGSRFCVLSLFLIYHWENSHDRALVLHRSRIWSWIFLKEKKICLARFLVFL